MTQKHTPEPWVDDNTGKYYKRRVIRHNGLIVATLIKDSTMDDAEHEANARLLAAVPKMYKALVAIEVLLRSSPCVAAYQHATDAIAAVEANSDA
jgi:hypothetical protein